MRSGGTTLAAALLGMGLCGLALSGCAGPANSPRDPGPAEIVEKWTSCAESAPRAGVVLPVPPGSAGPSAASPGGATPAGVEPKIGRIAPAFVPVAAVLCGREVRPGAGGGREQVATERRADEIGALVAALRLSDQVRGRGEVACTADLVIPPWLALLDDQGRWLRPYVPTDVCGKPRPEVRAALDGLRLTTVDSRTVGLVESSEAETAGCEQRWSDMVWVETHLGRPGRVVPGADPTVGPLRLCVYEVPPSERGGGKPAGDFVYGGPLPTERQTKALRALTTTRPAADCATPASRFAVLRSLDGGEPEWYVELDACRRFVVVAAAGGTQLGQGDATLAALLGPI
ncbi:hypothetical protein [Micromonospora lupini]|uniref:Secreted protein n=1 Tax=Micromonospora lupini str. Lupac 08 TaxID=1150864 RepID=I0LAQ4_9ACTN|nr:hypothetical protein [Micromonospora lupini]CCH20901.1 exported hypothetical protein [Micromonospora lupini str. Lupac 08]